MKFLVIAQDLRITGTSEGVVSRSFLAKLRKTYPNSRIDVQYNIHYDVEDKLNLLPVDSIEKNIVNNKPPFWINFLNKFYWRIFHESLKERYILNQFAKCIDKLNFESYDHIFVRSSGVNHEMIMALRGMPILKKAILNFHDPYPLAWYAGNNMKISKLDLFRLKRVIEVVQQAKKCISPAHYLSHDLQQLFASKCKFLTLPHQFEAEVFNLTDSSKVRKKLKKVSISYHGALMFGRNIENLLLAYQELLDENEDYVNNTEFVLRIKGDGVDQLKKDFEKVVNIEILDQIDFSNSAHEQRFESDIVIILENGPFYSNILVGKSPFLASTNKNILIIAPEKSELRNIVQNQQSIANMHSKDEIKQNLKILIENCLSGIESNSPFGTYFSDENFKNLLNKILKE